MSFYYMHDLIYALVLLVLFKLYIKSLVYYFFDIKRLFACLVYQKALAMFDLFLVSRDLAIMFVFTPLLMIDKKGGEEFVVYMHG